jgi:hypothetical protein
MQRAKVLTAVTVNITGFWNMTPCNAAEHLLTIDNTKWHHILEVSNLLNVG